MRNHGRIGRSYIEEEAPRVGTIGYRCGWSDADDYIGTFNPPHLIEPAFDFAEQSAEDEGMTGRARAEFRLGFAHRWGQGVKMSPGDFVDMSCMLCGDRPREYKQCCWSCVWTHILTIDEKLWMDWIEESGISGVSDIIIKLLRKGWIKPGDGVEI